MDVSYERAISGVISLQKADCFFAGRRRGRFKTALGKCLFDHILYELLVFRDEDHW